MRKDVNRLARLAPVALLALFSTVALASPVAGATAPPEQKAEQKPPEQKGPATGKFEGKEWSFEAYGAYAFPAEIGMDKEPGIRVAISNGGFSAEKLDLVWDREHVIDTYIRDQDTLIVYFDFAKDGKYKGMNYYFGSGDGCGYCFNGAVASTVKIENGRIHGSVKQKPEPDEPSWDVTFDAPIAPSDYGAPLPAGGGEQGKVYAAYHTALNGDSPAALEPLLDAQDGADLAKHGAEMLSSLRENHPTKSYKIVKGFTKGDRALLLVEGETEVMNVKNEVHLVKLDGTWRVYNEIMQAKLGGS